MVNFTLWRVNLLSNRLTTHDGDLWSRLGAFRRRNKFLPLPGIESWSTTPFTVVTSCILMLKKRRSNM